MRRSLLPIIAILLTAAGLRLTALDTQSFWNDEGNSARIAERTPRLIIEGAGGDIHPPGYYLMLSGWRALAGGSEFSLRFFSAAASLLGVAVVYALGVRLFERGVGTVAGLLAAVNPFQIYYAQEARMYALLALLAAASLLLTAEVLRIPGEMVAGRFNPRRAATVIGGTIAVNALGLYTHYSFPLVILAETVVFFGWLVRRERKGHGLAVWALLQGAALLLFAPWLGTAIRQITTWPLGGVGSVPLSEYVTAWAYGITLTPNEAGIGLLPLIIVALVGLFPPLPGDDAGRYLTFVERIGLVLLGAVVAPLALLAVGATSGSFLKFMLPANLALMVLAARGVVMGWRITAPMPTSAPPLMRGALVLFFALALAPMAIGLLNLRGDPAYARADYRGMAARIREEVGEDAAVVLNAPNQWEVFTYYYPNGPGVAPLPNDTTRESIEMLVANYSRIYAIYWGEGQQDPGREVETLLDALTFPISDEWVGDVRFVTYGVPADPATQPDTTVEAAFGDGEIVLEGYAISAEAARPGDAIGVTLFWRAVEPVERRYKVFVHLVDASGMLITQHDSEPASDLRPTDTWAPGETIVDNHGLLIPVGAAPGEYRLLVGLYALEDPAARLPTSEGSDALGIGTLTLD